MRHHPSAIVGDPARAFFDERISGPVVIQLVGRLFAAGSVWLGRDSDDRRFVAIDPLRSEPVACEISDQRHTVDGQVDLSAGMPSLIYLDRGLLKALPLTLRYFPLVSSHSRQLVGPTQEMLDGLIQVLEQFKTEEGGHFDRELDEPIEFMALWRGDEASRTLLGYWAGLSPDPQRAGRIHFRGQGTWIPRSASEAPTAESFVRVHPDHWRVIARAMDDGDLIPDAALMLLPVGSSGDGFTVRDLPAETTESLAQAHVVHGGSPDDPLGAFIDGRAEWSSDLLLSVLLDLANNRPLSLSAQPNAEAALETTPPKKPRVHDDSPDEVRRTADEPVEIPVAPVDSSWATLANYAVALAGTPHLDEPEPCGDRDCAIYHAALAVMTPADQIHEDVGARDWTRFAIERLTGDALQSLTRLHEPFSSLYMEAPPGPFVQYYRAWVPPIREAHKQTLAELGQMLSGLYMLAYPDRGSTDLSENALRQAGFEIPAWRDPLDDW